MNATALNHQIAAALDVAKNAGASTGMRTMAQATARENAQNFEATFLNTMFQNMFTSADGEGPMGGSTGVGVWRSFLTDEFAKTFAKNGGIGLAEPVYRSLLAHQEAAAAQ